MSGPDKNKKKSNRTKYRALSITKSETTKTKPNGDEVNKKHPLCPLLAKDSEWVDILQTPQTSSTSHKIRPNVSEEEEELLLVECEEKPEIKPLVIMFPGLLEKDPQTLEGVLSKSMSTTEVTKHLVDLGEKANFAFMKKTKKLIPKEKIWLESLTEASNSLRSEESTSFSTNYDADNEVSEYDVQESKPKIVKKHIHNKEREQRF